MVHLLLKVLYITANIVTIKYKHAHSPDIICRDHDLSIYTANFYETNSKEKSSIIWEGHGLLSWIIEQEIQIYGKPNYADNSVIDVYIDLQPVIVYIVLKCTRTRVYWAFHTYINIRL